jgi:hypothetical protein
MNAQWSRRDLNRAMLDERPAPFRSTKVIILGQKHAESEQNL